MLRTGALRFSEALCDLHGPFAMEIGPMTQQLGAMAQERDKQMELRGPSSEADGSRALAQKDVSRTFAGDVLRAFITQGTQIDAVQEVLAGTE